MKPVAVIDYGLGNLFSIQNACLAVHIPVVITASPKDIENASAVILPGVGAFGRAMDTLKKLGLIAILKEVAYSGKPFIGICLGMQLMLTESDEFGSHEGLDLIPGKVMSFKETASPGSRVPHIGWNKIWRVNDGCSDLLTRGLEDGSYMYFVHSFFCAPDDRNIVMTTTPYADILFCSSFRRGNLYGFQFHPERSGANGILIYENLAKMILESHVIKEI